ncbi:hypothetical protein SLEP1_g17877 [Rubroshorea leprosula]|uniref:Uncharacterized protein n=1 Tax=Rubroshorea leprosula TaxID=152421 RepID=A0AAV5J182_9ROSI|nr:hypothetical protein SLEP1_g17877 [Rubroshorea leprosula]
MAERLDDGEFLLPPQLLTDDDVVLMHLGSDVSKSLFPFELPYRFGSFGLSSDLSSPVESVFGSTETESDEEEYLSGLTRQMARSTLQDNWRQNERAFATENTKGLLLSGSPQSMLCAVGSSCGCRQWSSRGSPRRQSLLPSSPRTWDLLHAATVEVTRMQGKEEPFNHERSLLAPPKKPPTNLDVGGFYSSQSLSHKKLQSTQFPQLKREQQIMRQRSASAWAVPKQQPHVAQLVGGRSSSTTRPLGLSPSEWPPAQQSLSHNGSGMRAGFPGNPSGKRKCAGTGVFLPPRVGCTTETRKKPECCTILLQGKVVQALNLNLDEIGPQPHFNRSYTLGTDAAMRAGNANIFSNQRRNFKPQQGMNDELRLPQEWTY